MKRQRQQALLDLVRREPLSSQEEIRRRLARLGHATTQATVSRDLDELGLVRIRDHGGRLRYAPPDGTNPQQKIPLRALLQEFTVDVHTSRNLVLLNTPPGAANTVARAIDVSGVPGVLGTVAGDDTILIVTGEGVRAGGVAARLRKEAGLA